MPDHVVCTVAATRPLRRSRHARIIAGVCGGIAEWRGWKPVWVRVAFVVGSIVPIVPGFLVYVAMWLLVPKETTQEQERGFKGVRR